MKNCVHCGAQLPDAAGFCPYCRRRQAEEDPKKERRRPWRKLMAIGAVVALALAVWGIAALVAALRYTPRDFDAQGPMLSYSDRSGSYVLTLRWDTGESGSETSRVISEGQTGSASSLLYAYDGESGADARAAFLRRMESLSVEALPRAGAEAMSIGEPGPDGSSVRGVSLSYTTACGTNDIVWTLKMKNGDTITLRHALRTVRQRSLSFSYKDYDMDTLEALEALLEQIAQSSDAEAAATVYLPPVRYEGGLRLDKRSFVFVGSSRGEDTTCFTDTVYVEVRTPQTMEFSNIRFEGEGGTGLSAEEGAILRGCSFEGWNIGVHARDGSWVAAFDCDFIANGVGFRFDSSSSTLSSPTYSGDRFIGNGIGFQILRTPSREVLSFPGCWFERNSTDIDNPIWKTINTRGATFVKAEDGK